MPASGIDEAVVATKAASLQAMSEGIASLPLETEGSFVADPRMVAAGESFLRRGLEALFDLGRHILAKGFARPAVEYKEIARQLRDLGVLEPEIAGRLIQMAGYRNRLVHDYDQVTPTELYRILTEHSGDLVEALARVQAWLEAHPELVDVSL